MLSANLEFHWGVQSDHVQPVDLLIFNCTDLHPYCMSSLVAVGTLHFEVVVCSAALLHAISLCTVGAFLGALVGTCNISIGLIVEALHQSGYSVEHFTCVYL